MRYFIGKDTKTVLALIKLGGYQKEITCLINCFDVCPHCKKKCLIHKDHFIKDKRLYATGFCPRCGYIDKDLHAISKVYE